MTKNTHGGTRPGAGRPAKRGETTVSTSLRLTPTMRAYLSQCDESSADVIEDVVRRTAAYRRWASEQLSHEMQLTGSKQND